MHLWIQIWGELQVFSLHSPRSTDDVPPDTVLWTGRLRSFGKTETRLRGLRRYAWQSPIAVTMAEVRISTPSAGSTPKMSGRRSPLLWYFISFSSSLERYYTRIIADTPSLWACLLWSLILLWYAKWIICVFMHKHWKDLRKNVMIWREVIWFPVHFVNSRYRTSDRVCVRLKAEDLMSENKRTQYGDIALTVPVIARGFSLDTF